MHCEVSVPLGDPLGMGGHLQSPFPQQLCWALSDGGGWTQDGITAPLWLGVRGLASQTRVRGALL